MCISISSALGKRPKEDLNPLRIRGLRPGREVIIPDRNRRQLRAGRRGVILPVIPVPGQNVLPIPDPRALENRQQPNPDGDPPHLPRLNRINPHRGMAGVFNPRGILFP